MLQQLPDCASTSINILTNLKKTDKGMEKLFISESFRRKDWGGRKIGRVMKLTTCFLVLCSCFAFAHQANSQEAKVSLNMQNVQLEKVLDAIEAQTEYLFISNRHVDLNQRVSVSVENKPVQEVLETVLSGIGLSFEMEGVNIILTKPEKTLKVYSQQDKKTITGTIVDRNGDPVVGANVVEKGTTNGTITDMEGHFSLNVSYNAIINVTYIGYKSYEFKVGNRNLFDIILEEDTETLDEVVVIGYGTARRKDLTGAISTVKMEDSPLAASFKVNALEALKGVTPGLVIGASNSAGNTPSMLIRGQNSLNGSNDPLIVLDGVIFLGNMGDINPNDIASFEILKDASSSAVYGSRAANGVIVITSKKGKLGKPTITLNTSIGTQVWQQKPNLMDPEEFIEVRKLMMDGADPLDFLESPEKENYQNGKTTDWLDLVSRNGLTQDYQLSVSGGSEKMNYYISGSYTDQKGVIVGDDYKRFTLRMKVDTDITKWLKIGVDGTYNLTDYSGVAADLQDAMTMSPYGSPYRDEEKKLLERWPTSQSTANPLWHTDKSIRENVDKDNNFRVLGYAHVKFPFIKGLSYRLNFTGTKDFDITDNFTYEGWYISEGTSPDRYSPESVQSLLSKANGSIARGYGTDWVVDNILNYKNQFGKHFVDVTAVYTRDYDYYKTVTAKGSDFASNGNTSLGFNGLSKAAVQTNDISSTKKTNVGYLIRLGYTFDDKYHLTASYRRDGSSVFGVNNKWGNFPSIGVGWTISNEKFMKNISNYVNRLKLRLSLGKNGNQGIGPYSTLSKINNGPDGGIRYEFSDNPSKILYGMNIAGIGNSLLGWETTSALNVGIDAGFLNDRIALNLDFYFSKTTDQIFDRGIPGMVGFTTIKTSMGQVNNKGVEFTINTTNVKTKDFRWNSSLIFWLNRNILAKLYGEDLDGDGKEDDDIGNSRFIGKSLGAIYGYEAIGIVQEEDEEYIKNVGARPGDVKFRDLDGDGYITAENDRKILGYNKANFRLNLANTFSYKNLEVYLLLTGTFGGNGYYLTSNRRAFIHASSRNNDNGISHPYWTPENRNNEYPSVSYNDNKFLGLQSRAHVRIQDLTFAYRFTQPWVTRIGLSSLKVFASAKNLYTFTGWVGGDPEKGIQARSGTYPVPTSYSMGINVSF